MSFFALAMNADTRTSHNARLMETGSTLLGSYAVSTLAGALAHQFLPGKLHTSLFRHVWKICVGAVGAVGGIMGATASAIARLPTNETSLPRFVSLQSPTFAEHCGLFFSSLSSSRIDSPWHSLHATFFSPVLRRRSQQCTSSSCSFRVDPGPTCTLTRLAWPFSSTAPSPTSLFFLPMMFSTLRTFPLGSRMPSCMRGSALAGFRLVALRQGCVRTAMKQVKEPKAIGPGSSQTSLHDIVKFDTRGSKAMQRLLRTLTLVRAVDKFLNDPNSPGNQVSEEDFDFSSPDAWQRLQDTQPYLFCTEEIAFAAMNMNVDQIIFT